MYMRKIEQWLWETGWGSIIPDVEIPKTQDMEEGQGQEEFILAEDGSPSEAGTDSDEQDGAGDEEVHEDDELGGGDDEDDEIIEDEETLEGGFGYSTFQQNKSIDSDTSHILAEMIEQVKNQSKSTEFY